VERNKDEASEEGWVLLVEEEMDLSHIDGERLKQPHLKNWQ
jgi:hypothetical protein